MDWNKEYELYYNRVTGMQKEIPAPKDIFLPEDTVVDKDLIQKLINDHQEQIIRADILMDYYLGYAPILERVKEPHKPNNRLVAPYPSYITDILTGMFIGEPVTYSVSDEYREDLERIQVVFDYNDEQDESYEIAKYNSIMGKSYEIVYVEKGVNRGGQEALLVKFNELSLRDVIYVYDTKINPEPLFAIYIQGEREDRLVHLFHRDYIALYQGIDLEEISVQENIIGKVQIIESRNNDEALGDFERVLGLIDAYNKAISDTANDFEEFTDAFLVLKGMLNTDEEDIAQLKRDKVILLDSAQPGGSQDAEWLVKDINNQALEDHKIRLDEDIHRFTKVPNLIDEKFGGNSSGVALKYKLLGLRQVIAMKERKFKRFLEDRLEIIIDFLRTLGEDIEIEHYDIDIVFNLNTPIDEEANVKMVKELMNIVSEKTALSQLFFIDNANEEMENKRLEDDTQLEMYTNFIMQGDEEEGTEDDLSDDRDGLDE